MDLDSFLKNVSQACMGANAESISSVFSKLNLNAKFVDLIVTYDDFDKLNDYCKMNMSFGNYCLNMLNWEIFDKVFNVSFDGVDEQGAKSLRQTVNLLSTAVAPRELYMMVAEKMSLNFDTDQLQFLLYALQLALVKRVSSDSKGAPRSQTSMHLWKQGLNLLLHHLETMVNHTLTNASFVRLVTAVLTFSAGVATRSIEWVGGDVQPARLDTIIRASVVSDVDSGDEDGLPNILIGFLLKLSELLFVMVPSSSPAPLVPSADDAPTGDDAEDIVPISSAPPDSLSPAEMRRQYMHVILQLVTLLTGGQLDQCLFEHLYRKRFQIYQEETHLAFDSHCRNYFTRSGQDRSGQQLTTDDANSILTRIAQSEYCEELGAYYEAAMSNNHNSNRAALEAGPAWLECISWETVTPERCYRNDVYLQRRRRLQQQKLRRRPPKDATAAAAAAAAAQPQGDGITGSSNGGGDDDDDDDDDQQKEEDDKETSEMELDVLDGSWSVTGLAMVVHAFVQALAGEVSPPPPPPVPHTAMDAMEPPLRPRTHLDSSSLIPYVYSIEYLHSRLLPYALLLLRPSPPSRSGDRGGGSGDQQSAGTAAAILSVACKEGLELMAFLHPVTPVMAPSAAIGSSSDLPNTVTKSFATATATALSAPRLFMSFLAQQGSAVILAHLQLAFYTSLPMLLVAPRIEYRQKKDGSRSKHEIQRYWSAADAAKLAAIAAHSTDTLAIAQALISSMAQCSDYNLRSRAYQALRTLLKNIEDRSLFGLLNVLTSTCPYPNITGLLIDIAKECVQVAAAATSNFGENQATVVDLAETKRPVDCWCNARTPRDHYSHLLVSSHSSSLPLSDVSGSGTTERKGTHMEGWLDEFPKHRTTFPLHKVLLPTSGNKGAETIAAGGATTGSEAVAAATAAVGDRREIPGEDIDDMLLTGTTLDDAFEHDSARKKKKSKQTHRDIQQAALQRVEDIFVDLRTGSTNLAPERLVELQEAAPYMWAGATPFWSPLLIDRYLVAPLEEVLELSSEKLLEGIDVLSARVNLLLFVILKFSAELELSTNTTSNNDNSNNNASTSSTPSGRALNVTHAKSSRVIDSFFSGCAFHARSSSSSSSTRSSSSSSSRPDTTEVAAGGFPFAYNKVRAVREIFRLYSTTKKLSRMLSDCLQQFSAANAQPAAIASQIAEPPPRAVVSEKEGEDEEEGVVGTGDLMQLQEHQTSEASSSSGSIAAGVPPPPPPPVPAGDMITEVRLQVLQSSVDYAVQRMHSMCNSLFRVLKA